MIAIPLSDDQRARFRVPARIAGITGSVVMTASVLLAWSYDHDALDDMAFWGAPSPLQINFAVLAILSAAIFAVPFLGRARLKRWAKVVAWNSGALTAAIGLAVFVLIAMAAIAIESGGLVNLDPGAWVALVGALMAVGGGRLLRVSPEPTMGAV